MVPIGEIVEVTKSYVQPTPSQLELNAQTPHSSSGSESDSMVNPWHLIVRLARPYCAIIKEITDMKPEVPRNANKNKPS